MQLKNIGELTKSIKNNGDIVSALKGFSSLQDAADALNKFDDSIDKVSLLKQAFSGTSEDVAKAALGIHEIGTTAVVASRGIGSLGNALIGFISENAVAIGITAAVTGITALISAIKEYHVTAEESKEKLSNMFSDYSSNESEIESLNSELDDTQSKINELQAKGHLSLVEQEDLSKLKTQNQELERTLSLKEAQQKIDAKSLASQADETFEKTTNRQNTFNQNTADLSYDKNLVKQYTDAYTIDAQARINSILGKTTDLSEFVNPSDDIASSRYELINSDIEDENINALIARYKAIQNEQEVVNTNMAEMIKNGEDTSNLLSYSNQLDQNAVTIQQQISSYADNLQTAYDSYQKALDEGVITKSQLQNMEYIKDFFKEYSKFIGDYASSTEDAITNIFAKKQFEGVEDSLVKAGKKGETAVQNMIKSTPGLEKALDDADISVQDLSDHIMAIADPDSLNFKEIKRQLKDAFIDDKYDLNFQMGESADRTWENFIKGKSQKDLTTFWQYVNDNNLDLSSMSGEDLEYNLSIAIKGKEELDEVKNTFDMLREDSEGNETDFGKTIDDFRSEMESLSKTAVEAKTGLLDDSAIADLIEDYPELADKTDDLASSIEKLRTSKIKEFSKDWKEGTKNLTGEDLDKATDYYTHIMNSLSISKVGFDRSVTDGVLSQIQAAQNELNGQASGFSIDISAFNSDELRDYQTALEYVNGTLQLNIEKVKEISKAKADETITQNNLNKANAQAKYVQNQRDIESLNKSLIPLNTNSQEYIDTVNQINSLELENDSIVDACQQWDLMNASIREAIGEYQAWKDAQNAPQSGDMFDDTKSMWKTVRDVNDSSSENYGKVGNADYITSVDFLVPDTIDHEDQAAVNSYLDSISKYLTVDENNNPTGLNLQQFMEDSTKLGLMTLDEETGEYKIAGEHSMQEFADGLNMSLPLIQAIFGELEEYLPESKKLNWGDSDQTLGDLAVKAGEAKNSLSQLSQFKDLDLTIDVSDMSNPEQKISTLQSTINQLNTEKTKLDVDSSEYNQANSIISYCVAQIQNLSAPVVMKVDASSIENVDVSNAVQSLQDLQSAVNDKNAKIAIGADTSEIDAADQKIQESLDIIKNNSEVYAKVGIKVDDSTTVDDLINQLQGQDESVYINVGAKVDSAQSALDKLNSEKIEDKEFGITANDYASSTIRSINSELAGLQGKTIDITTNRIINTINNNVSGVHKLNGSAHAKGTAYANGNWSTDSTETALVGELGREMVIDPRTGRWYTVGDNGAEFTKIPRGSIVFNHLQTEDLLSKGFVSARGTALVNGTAYGGGKNSTVTGGGWSTKVVNTIGGKSNNSTNSGSGNTSSSGNNSKKKKSSSKSGVDKVSKAIEKISKWVSQHFDWIEVKIDHLQKKADSYYTKAQNAIDQGLNRSKNYKTAESNIKKSISTNEQLITANQQGSARYQKEANAVKKKYDSKLSKKNKATFDKAVKTLNDGGKIDISVYNADVKTALEDYQKWYDKVLETKYAVDDLNSTLIEQKQALFNLPIDQATAKVNKLEVALSKLQLKFAKRSTGKNTSIKTQNDEQDDELKNQKSQLNVQKNALDKAKANLKSAKKDQKSNQKSIIKNRQSLVVDQMSKKVADVKVRSSSSDLLKDSKISKTLTKKQKADLKKGKSISLSKSQKRKLSKSQQSKISDYNKDVKSSNKIASKISTDKQNISKAQKSADSKNQTLQLAQDAYDTQLKTTNEAEKDYLEQIVANEKQKFDNVVSYFEKRTNLIEKQNSRKTAMGAYESAKDYNTLISQTTQKITEMNRQLNDSVKKGKIQVGSDEWYEMKSQIVETETELANLNETARKTRLQEMFERAAESVQKFIDKLQTVNSLITDDMKFDKDGKLTQNGALSMMLDSKSLDESKEKLKTYTKEREKILTTEWESKGYSGSYVRGVDSELDGLLDDIDSNIKSEVGNIQNYMQSLLNTVISANEKERDAILEVVDAHKEALSKKKDYYDYDKKMKSQNKTISELERQAAGLRGSTDKADKSQLQKIEAQLKDAKDERDDMVKDHLYEMQTDALDQISDDINKYYKEMIDALKNSPTEAANAITKFMTDNKITSAGLADQIASVLKQYIDPNNKDSKGTEEEIKNSGLTGTLPSQLPENSKTLTDAFKDLVSKINTNGYGTAATTKQINDAQAAYNKLSSTEKSYVSADYKKLTDAKTANKQESDRIAKAAADKNKKQQEEPDKKKQQKAEAAKLKTFQNAIKALGTDYGSAAMTKKLAAADTAYKALTDAQKKTVASQYSTLTTAKNKHKQEQTRLKKQGNGKIDIGDKITITSNEAGAWKYSNKVKSKNSLNKMLKKGATYYVGGYNKNDPFPVHLYSDKERKKSVGWVRSKWLKGYASGTRSVDGDQLAWVNENWQSNGGEIIYRKSDGAMLMPLGNGDTVFSADKVQALYKMLETNPLPMNMGNVFTPRDLTTQIQTVNNTPMNFTVSQNVNVQGDLTRDTLPNLQEILKKSSEYTQNEIRKDLVKAGRKKTFH